jgi:hypothetical protein
MKIKILKSRIIVDALINSSGEACFFQDGSSFLYTIYKGEYEIIPEPRRPKFKIGDMVSYISGVGGATAVFKIVQIRIHDKVIIYCDYNGGCTEEEFLTIHTEPEKPKTYKYVEAKLCDLFEHTSIQFYKKIEG